MLSLQKDLVVGRVLDARCQCFPTTVYVFRQQHTEPAVPRRRDFLPEGLPAQLKHCSVTRYRTVPSPINMAEADTFSDDGKR